MKAGQRRIAKSESYYSTKYHHTSISLLAVASGRQELAPAQRLKAENYHHNVYAIIILIKM